MKPLFQLGIILALITLVAARPWKYINHAIGLKPATELMAESQDSLMMQPVNIVLPPSAVDELTERIEKRDSLKLVLRRRSKLADAEIARCRLELATKESQVRQLQQEIVSQDEIQKLTMQQRREGFP